MGLDLALTIQIGFWVTLYHKLVSYDHFHFLTMHPPLAPQNITTYTSTLNPPKDP